MLASCDPAAGLLAAEYARASGFRLLVFPRGGRAALDLLRQGLVHVAGVHYSTEASPKRNAENVRAQLAGDCQLLRVAKWESGIALAADDRSRSAESVARRPLRWAARESGSAARECLDELLGSRRFAGREVNGHAAVAEAVRAGWAEAGVCVRFSAEDAGLNFLPLRTETLDLCFPAAESARPPHSGAGALAARTRLPPPHQRIARLRRARNRRISDYMNLNPEIKTPPLEIRLTEIGRVHSPFKQATGTPIQPYRAGSAPGYITLRPEFVDGLADLDGFDRVWLIYWFHRASAAKMSVIPYRDTVAHGLFATRVPARPNTIGMSCVRLLNIEGCILRLRRSGHSGRHAAARHQALRPAIRQLSRATLRLAGSRAGQTRRGRRPL